jgi:hypothetical protein
MKRPLFIIFGIIIIVVLLIVWIYVLFFSDRDSDGNRFADFNFGDTTIDIDQSPVVNIEPVVAVTGPTRLRQLTTKPTAGYQEVQFNASATPAVWYAEAGTGHIFSIDLETGEEKRVSGTTIPLTQTAAITPNSQYVMFQSGLGVGREFIVGTFSTSSENITTGVLAETIIDFTTTTDNTFLYAAQTTNSVIAKEYDPATDTTTTLFTIPFREAVLVWGRTANDVHYAYPKASSKLEGFVYRIENSNLERLPVDGFGLTAVGSASTVIYNRQGSNRYVTHAYNTVSRENISYAFNLFPEKCTSLNLSDTLVCGGDFFPTYDYSSPDSWYQGIVTYVDDLMEVDIANYNRYFLSNITEESGRNLDIINIKINPTDERVYFSNKNDRTLWVFYRILEEMN